MTYQGAPAGLLINPDAARYALRGRSQLNLANAANVSPGHLSDVLKGKKGCTRETADKLASALEFPVGALFPQLAQFEVVVRRFEASRVAEVAA